MVAWDAHWYSMPVPALATSNELYRSVLGVQLASTRSVTAAAWRRFHATAAVAWLFPGILLAYVIVYHLQTEHAAFAILAVSLYANAATHWSAYQAARAESVADPNDHSTE
jgi:hypothetical protein